MSVCSVINTNYSQSTLRLKKRHWCSTL